MRYIVFSFDDGLADFKENALPILKKYGFKCTINVISGFSDGTVKTDFEYLSVNDIIELHNSGFEIANHTDSHLRGGSFDELLLCNKKINQWCSHKDIVGIAMPKYEKPSKDSIRYINQFKPPYIAYEKRRWSVYMRIKCIYYKLLYLFKRDDLSFCSYFHQVKMYKRGKSKFLRRFTVKFNIAPQTLFDSLSTIKDEYCLTICFHSITNDPDNCSFPRGAWTPEQFDTFCRLLSEHKSDYKVTTQSEVCQVITK